MAKNDNAWVGLGNQPLGFEIVRAEIKQCNSYI